MYGTRSTVQIASSRTEERDLATTWYNLQNLYSNMKTS